MRLVTVAVPVPSLGPLTYTVPEAVATPRPGARVLVPLGKRLVTGCVLQARADAPPDGADLEALKPLADVLDDRPFLPDAISGSRPGWRSTTPAAWGRRSPQRCRRAPGWRASGTCR